MICWQVRDETGVASLMVHKSLPCTIMLCLYSHIFKNTFFNINHMLSLERRWRTRQNKTFHTLFFTILFMFSLFIVCIYKIISFWLILWPVLLCLYEDAKRNEGPERQYSGKDICLVHDQPRFDIWHYNMISWVLLGVILGHSSNHWTPLNVAPKNRYKKRKKISKKWSDHFLF